MRFLHALIVSIVCLVSAPAAALDAINVPLDVEALDLTRAVDRFVDVGERIQVSTAPGLDGIVRRIEVRARETGGVGNWVVFALTNTSNEQIDRLLVAPHFRLANSQIIWPDLGASRLVTISPSQGFTPERLESQEADVFRITLDPGAVVTYVIELRTSTLPQLVLWDEDAYRDSVNATTLFKGIVLGIAGLLALFLTILFIVKRSAMFPAVAGVAWAVLAYLAIEFGFWNQIFDLQPGDEQVSRAIAEVVLAATLVLLLYAYLSLSAVHTAFFRIGLVWAAFFSALLGLAVYEPQIAAGIARMGLGVIGLGGFLVILPMSIQGFDRAVHLIPSWIVFLGWLLAAWLAVTGHIVNDFVSPALAGGLVLIVLLLGFTVMQHAFAGGTLAEGLVSDSERKVLALSGSGDLVWDWDLARDRVYSSPATEDILGLKRGSLAGPFQEWLSVIHPGERDHFRHVVETVVETARGRIDQTLRMRAEDGHFRWFRLRARPVVAGDNVFRLIGTMLDVTDMKTTQERLLRDAVHDSLTGLPNREIFLDRIQAAIERARQEDAARPTVVIVNIDHFAQHNTAIGTSAADSLLTMVARRIDRLLKPHDTLSRFSGDQFAVLLLSEQTPAAIARLTEQIRRALKSPVVFGEDEVNLTVSIGLATYDPNSESADDVMQDAQIAMAHAKRLGGDRCEAFRPSLREHGRSVAAVEADLKRALDRGELKVFYQPIIRLADRSIAGFEALLRWDHPRHGRMAPAEFVPIAERSGLIIPVGLFVLERAARDLNQWMRDDADAAGLFTSVNVSSRQLLRHDLLNDLRAILARADLSGAALKLEITESLVMENPEYTTQVLARCRELGIGLSLDDFGTGYSSLAYLQRFPFDTIKIDQSFVRDMEPGEPAVVLGAIVALGHDLEMDIVAEGIEDEDAAGALAGLGCEFGQGYLFGHPMPAADVPAFLRDYAEGQAVMGEAAPTALSMPAALGEDATGSVPGIAAQPEPPIARPEPARAPIPGPSPIMPTERTGVGLTPYVTKAPTLTQTSAKSLSQETSSQETSSQETPSQETVSDKALVMRPATAVTAFKGAAPGETQPKTEALPKRPSLTALTDDRVTGDAKTAPPGQAADRDSVGQDEAGKQKAGEDKADKERASAATTAKDAAPNGLRRLPFINSLAGLTDLVPGKARGADEATRSDDKTADSAAPSPRTPQTEADRKKAPEPPITGDFSPSPNPSPSLSLSLSDGKIGTRAGEPGDPAKIDPKRSIVDRIGSRPSAATASATPLGSLTKEPREAQAAGEPHAGEPHKEQTRDGGPSQTMPARPRTSALDAYRSGITDKAGPSDATLESRMSKDPPASRRPLLAPQEPKSLFAAPNKEETEGAQDKDASSGSTSDSTAKDKDVPSLSSASGDRSLDRWRAERVPRSGAAGKDVTSAPGGAGDTPPQGKSNGAVEAQTGLTVLAADRAANGDDKKRPDRAKMASKAGADAAATEEPQKGEPQKGEPKEREQKKASSGDERLSSRP